MNKISNSHSRVFLNITDENPVKEEAASPKKQANSIASSKPLALRDITNQTPAQTQEKHIADSQTYSFRDTTNKKREKSHAVPFQKQTRTILKPGTTPSVVVTNKNRELDPNISKIKAELRIHFYFINAIIEAIHNIPLNRTKTALQGTSAPKGCQAAHASLAPNTKDSHTTNIIQRVIEVGVTPTKTEPFLRQRINLSTPEKQTLNANHKDENFVSQFITKRLPKDGFHSILTGTQYHWNCNATFENPDESNQYDSRLEKTIAPILKELQQLRLDGTNTPEESTEKLVAWLIKYYDESIANIQKQIALLEQTASSLDKMHIFEQKHLNDKELPSEEFDTYLKEVAIFLETHRALMEKKAGCPTCRDLKDIRNDFSSLEKLISSSNPADYYLNNRRHLIKQEPFCAEGHLEKFNLYLLEAKTQKAAVEVFTEACTIQGLKTSIFGVYENGIRRTPTDAELKSQVYAISAPMNIPKNKVSKKIKLDENASEATETVTKKKKTTHADISQTQAHSTFPF